MDCASLEILFWSRIEDNFLSSVANDNLCVDINLGSNSLRLADLIQ